MKIARRWRTSLQPKNGTGLENKLGQPRPFRLTANTFCSSYDIIPTACSALALLMGSDERFRRVATVHACGSLYYIYIVGLRRQTNPEENLPFKVHLKEFACLTRAW